MKYSLCYAVISCIIALFMEVCYLKFPKKKVINKRDFYANITIVAIIILSVLGSLLTYTEWKENKFVSSGLCLVAIMFFSNLLITGIIKLQYKNREEQRKEYEYISVLYLIALIFNLICCGFYMKSSELVFTYIAIICGKFIWFDAGIDIVIENFRILLKTGLNQLISNHKGMLVYEMIILLLVLAGLVFQLLDSTGNALYIINGICFGVGMSGFILVITALEADRKIKNDDKFE